MGPSVKFNVDRGHLRVSPPIYPMVEVNIADRILEILAQEGESGDAVPPTMKEMVAELPTDMPPEDMPSDEILSANWTNDAEVIALKAAISRHLLFNTTLTSEQINVLKDNAFKRYEFFRNHPDILVRRPALWILGNQDTL